MIALETDRTALRFLIALALLISLLGCYSSVYAKGGLDVESELSRADRLVKSDPQQARAVLAALESAQGQLEATQIAHLQLLKASVLGFLNQHHERVAYINGLIDTVKDPNFKSKLLYLLSSSYVALGEYEQALGVMNASIGLLPNVSDTIAKVDTLQSAIDLLNSLHAYDEALSYANRMYDLPVLNQDLSAKCIASSDRVEIYMLLNQRSQARAQMREAVDLCDKKGWTYISQIVKAFSAIDLIDNQEYESGIAAGLPVLHAFPSSRLGLNYVSSLENGLARAYLNTGRLVAAEQYGLQAYQHAASQKLVQQTEKALETLAQIKRAQGQYGPAFDYAEQALVQKNALLDEQLQKNVAYQRVRFSMQDQFNQVTLLEKQNKILAIEEQLEKKNNQNLWLIIALVMIVASALGLYLWKVIRLKNFFHRKTQIDGLTRISNRSHFMTSAEHIVSERSGVVSLIVFDMDFFKRINDNFGHPAGDWVLSAVCHTVSTVLRHGDLFGRIGGEEFAICLPDTDPEMAWQLAQRCRAAIAAIDTAPTGFQFPLSASFGVASAAPNDGTQYAQLMVAADKALYQAKSDGRNCVSR